jgi:phenylacetate-CoA ligase
MTDTHRTYWDEIDFAAIARDHPIGDPFVKLVTSISRDELRARQEVLFARCVDRAWKTAFYRRLWGDAGVKPGDIRSLDDLPSLPSFDKSDIMKSIEIAPPFGDFAGFDSYPEDKRPPVIFHTTSGTTGRPQVLLFGPKSREVQNLLLARLYRWQGLRSGDVVHSVYGHGMINGGHYVREAVTHWTSAVFMSAGTGVETRSAQQVELMKTFDGVRMVLPAHGLEFEDLSGRATAIERHHLERLDTLRTASGEIGSGTVHEFMQVLFQERSWGSMAESETYAHLEHLRLTGEATVDESGEQLRYHFA